MLVRAPLAVPPQVKTRLNGLNFGIERSQTLPSHSK
jgi:hypothetical protein